MEVGDQVRVVSNSRYATHDITYNNPKYKDTTAHIIQVPKYPDTWVKVMMQDGKTKKVRTSQIRPIKDGIVEKIEYGKPCSRREKCAAGTKKRKSLGSGHIQSEAAAEAAYGRMLQMQYVANLKKGKVDPCLVEKQKQPRPNDGVIKSNDVAPVQSEYLPSMQYMFNAPLGNWAPAAQPPLVYPPTAAQIACDQPVTSIVSTHGHATPMLSSANVNSVQSLQVPTTVKNTDVLSIAQIDAMSEEQREQYLLYISEQYEKLRMSFICAMSELSKTKAMASRVSAMMKVPNAAPMLLVSLQHSYNVIQKASYDITAALNANMALQQLLRYTLSCFGKSTNTCGTMAGPTIDT